VPPPVKLVLRSGPRPDAARLASESGLHPELVRHLIALGLGSGDGAQLRRAARLRSDLGLNYAGAVLACELLARIDALEARLRRYER
jgi:hypothetical protein